MSTSILDPYVDGWIGSEGRELTKVPVRKFPFKTNPIRPDVWTREYERDFEVLPDGYTTRVAARTAWTNLVTNSEDFTTAAWTKTNATASANVGTGPDGNTTLGKVLESSATGEHSVSQAATVTAAETEASVFAQAGLTRRVIRLAFTDSAAATFYADFDVQGGTALSRSTGVTAILTPCGNSQFYCMIRFTPAAGAGTLKINISSTPGTVSYAGNTALGVYLWGAQVSEGVKAPYVSTTTITRTALTPDRDPSDPLAFLIFETDIDPANEASARVRRTFSRVPLQQTDPGSRFITKPELPGEFPQVSGSSLIVQPEENVPRWIFYTQLPVINDSGVPTGQSPTGGTWNTTITIGANSSTTAALPYNLSAATLQSTLNALAVMATYNAVATVTGSYTTGFVVSIAYGSVPTVDTSGLTGHGLSIYTYAGASVSVVQTYVGRFIFQITALGGGGAPPPPNSASFDGGTFRVLMFGQTSGTIPYNGTISDVQSAIAGMTNLPAGTTVEYLNGAGYVSPGIWRGFGSYQGDQIGFIINVPVGTVAVSGASLTPSGSTAVATPVAITGTWQTRVTLTGVNLGQRILTTDSVHGIDITDGIVVTQGASFRTISPGLYSVSPTTVTLTAASGEAYSNTTPITFVGKSTGSVYTAGSKLTRIKRITDYYLPGVTPGITTSDDIPLPTYEGDDASMLAAIFSGDTDINYEVGELGYYRDGPILERTRTTLDASQL